MNPSPSKDPLRTPVPLGRATLLAGLAYFAAAKLGLLLSLPVGFVSPLWPAAGVALLLVLRFGARAGVGIALGSLASNLTAGRDGAEVLAWPLPDAPLLPLAVVAAGAALQAIWGLWLVRSLLARVPAGPFSLWTSLRLCGRAGPVACLVNATLAVLTLPTFTELPWNERGPLAVIWWLGDALGVLGVMPLALFALRTTDLGLRPWRDASAAVAATAVTALSWLITVALGGVETRDVQRFELQRTAELVHELQAHFDRSALMLENYRAVYETGSNITDEVFERFSLPWIEPGSPVNVVAWAPRVESSGRAAFEARPPGGGPARPIRERDPGQPGLRVAGERAEYWPLTQRAPLGSVALGFDIASEPVRNAALQQALRQDGPAISGHVQLADDIGTPNVSVLMFRRVETLPPSVVIAAIRLNKLVEAALADVTETLPAGSRLLLTAGDETLLDHRLLADGTLSDFATEIVGPLQESFPLAAAGQSWSLRVALPPLHDELLTSVDWWVSQIMPQLLAVILGLALVNGALHTEHRRELENTLARLSSEPLPAPPATAPAAALPDREWSYRPLVDLGSGLLRGVLYRAATPPGDIEADTRRLKQVVADSRSWPMRRGDSFHFGLAVGAATLASAGWAQQVLDVLASQRLHGRRLLLSLDEADYFESGDALRAAMLPLRDAGVRIGLAGFRAEPHALAALQSLPIDRLQLDRRLGAALAHDGRVREIVRTLAQLCRNRGIELAVDGVDQADTALVLHSLGGVLASGQLFESLPTGSAVGEALLAARPFWTPPS